MSPDRIREGASRRTQIGMVGTTRSLEVALATHNSHRFLRELLDSLFAQTFQDFTLLVSDDASTDDTLAIVAEYAERHPGRVRLVAVSREVQGAMGNFASLLGHVTADYVLLCDHDDVWLPHKIEVSLERMLALEREHGADVPLLVHTDLAVVGPGLEELCPSYVSYAKVDPRCNGFRQLLTRNVATGCAMIFNRALYARACPIPSDAIMHDHWLALVAAHSGHIEYLGESTILYRQHGSNTMGARKWTNDPLAQWIKHMLFGEERRRILRLHSRQAAALLRRYAGQLSVDEHRTATALAGLWTVHPWRRFARLWRSGLRLEGIMRNAALFIAVTRR